jgi:hypothetical protein
MANATAAATIANLTPATRDLFSDLWNARHDWNGMPLFEGGKTERGNLTHLKKLGLVTSTVDEGCTFVMFTEAGREAGAALDAAKVAPIACDGEYVDQHGCPTCGASLEEIVARGHRPAPVAAPAPATEPTSPAAEPVAEPVVAAPAGELLELTVAARLVDGDVVELVDAGLGLVAATGRRAGAGHQVVFTATESGVLALHSYIVGRWGNIREAKALERWLGA